MEYANLKLSHPVRQLAHLGRTHTNHDFPLVLGLQLLLAAGVDLLEGWAITDKRLARALEIDPTSD